MEAESCTDFHCINLSHIDAIDNLYCDIVTSLKSAARDSADTANKNVRGKPNNIPGWNDYVKGLHSQARVKFKLWCDMGKPRGRPSLIICARRASSNTHSDYVRTTKLS